MKMRLALAFLPSIAILGLSGCSQPVEVVETPAPPVAEKPTALPPERMTTKLPLGIIGETEAVYLPDFSAPFEARIDTGATTSSIDAQEVRAFERDGRQWVSFRINSRNGGESKQYELPVVRTVRIKQHDGESLRRFCVMLTFRMGHLTLEREFTLTDRAKFKYPVLVGRNIINGLAVVDPSQRNVL